MKRAIVGGIGFAGIFAYRIFGGWDILLQSLLCLMTADFVTGMIVAGVFKNSPKTENHKAASNEFCRGIAKKLGMLIMVAMCYQLDLVLGIDYLRSGCIYSLLANEALSNLENIALMGIPIPKKLRDALEVLDRKE